MATEELLASKAQVLAHSCLRIRPAAVPVSSMAGRQRWKGSIYPPACGVTYGTRGGGGVTRERGMEREHCG
jgi:hypothetical protein